MDARNQQQGATTEETASCNRNVGTMTGDIPITVCDASTTTLSAEVKEMQEASLSDYEVTILRLGRVLRFTKNSQCQTESAQEPRNPGSAQVKDGAGACIPPK